VSSAKIDKLVRMANQIGDFFAALPEAEGVAGAANHLQRFWTPKMIGELVEHASQPNSGLNTTAERAVAKLRTELEARATPTLAAPWRAEPSRVS
jgi:hypothetical protein